MDDDALRKAKLAKVIEIEGYDTIEELMEAASRIQSLPPSA